MIGSVATGISPHQQSNIFLYSNKENLFINLYYGDNSIFPGPSGYRTKLPVGVIMTEVEASSSKRPHLYMISTANELWEGVWNQDSKSISWKNHKNPPGAEIIHTIGVTSSQGFQAFVYCLKDKKTSVWLCNRKGWLDLGKPEPGIFSAVGAVAPRYWPSGPELSHAFVVGEDQNLWAVWWTGWHWRWDNFGKPGEAIVGRGGAITVSKSPKAAQYPYVFVRSGSDLWVNSR